MTMITLTLLHIAGLWIIVKALWELRSVSNEHG